MQNGQPKDHAGAGLLRKRRDFPEAPLQQQQLRHEPEPQDHQEPGRELRDPVPQGPREDLPDDREERVPDHGTGQAGQDQVGVATRGADH